MPLKTILFAVGFVLVCVGALFSPIIGMAGYVLHYHISPERHWWEAPLSSWGIRYSFILAICLVVGFALKFRWLRYGKNFFTTHEVLVVLFLAVIWFSAIIGEGAPENLSATGEVAKSVVDPPEIKFTKVVIFLLVLTHLATDMKSLKIFLWTLILGVLYLSWQGYWAPRSMFVTGRLEGIGGPDFADSNSFGGHLAACLPIIGVMFLRSSWKGKLVCLVTGVLAVNAIILTRSRGVTVAIAGGMLAAVLAAPKDLRKMILVSVIVAAIGGYALTDPGFWRRAETITADERQRDASAQSRIDIWMASLRLLEDHPLGVGAGNFPGAIHGYLPQYAPKDAHNSYVLCYSELGVQGIIVYLLVIGSSVHILWRIRSKCGALPEQQRRDIALLNYGLAVSLSILILRGLTMSRLYTEGAWWILVLPLCLSRAVDNLKADLDASKDSEETSGTPALRARGQRKILQGGRQFGGRPR